MDGPTKPTISYEIKSLEKLKEILEKNPGYVVIKLGAEWCAPCKQIKPLVDQWFKAFITRADHVKPIVVDVDECIDVYGFLKKKRVINGIPAILIYKRGNTDYRPDDVIIGANPGVINTAFKSILEDV
jgi:thiol-disulfide isomerase/thioredoxin